MRVASARHQAEAELIAGLLLEEGVPSVVRRSGGFDVPDFLAAGPRDVLVAQSGEEVAREVLGMTGPATARAARPLWVQAFAIAMVLVVIAATVAGLALAVLG